MTRHRTAATLTFIAAIAAASPAQAGTCDPQGAPLNYYLTLCHNSNFPWCAIQQNCYFSDPFQDESISGIANPPGEVFQGTVTASSSPPLVSGVFTNSLSSAGGRNHSLFASAGWNCDDLLFTNSSNRAAGSAVAVQLSGYAFFSTSTSYSYGEKNPDCEFVTAAEVTEAYVSSKDPWLYEDNLVEGVWQAITGPVVSVVLGQEYLWNARIYVKTFTHTFNGCGQQTAVAGATIELQLGDLQPDGSYGPVFDLPSGITANAPSIGLIDNYFQPAAAPCPWDLDGSGDVGVTDLLAVLAAWGAPAAGPPDFDGDGVVGVTDLLALLGNWGPCP